MLIRRVAVISEQAAPIGSRSTSGRLGSSGYVVELARQLGERGYKSDLFTSSAADVELQHDAHDEAVRVVPVPVGPLGWSTEGDVVPQVGEFAQRILEAVTRQRSRYALMHANCLVGGLVATTVKHFTGLPFVVTLRSLARAQLSDECDPDRVSLGRLLVEERVIWEADAIIVESNQAMSEIRRLYGAPSSRIHLVPPSVGPDLLIPEPKESARRALGVADDSLLIVIPFSGSPGDGGEAAILALARLVPKLDADIRFALLANSEAEVLESTTSERARLLRLAEEAGIASRMTYVSGTSVERQRTFLAAADLFVCLPNRNVSVRTIREAMASGLPIVGTKVPELERILSSGDSGVIVAVGDVESHGRAIGELLGSPDRRAQMGAQGRDRAKREFLWPRASRAMAAVYDHVNRVASDAFGVLTAVGSHETFAEQGPA